MFIFDFVAETILDQILDWIYGKIIGFLNDFFVMMNNMGVELFELPWVEAVTTFFSYFGWALFGVGLVVGAFECTIEYQGGRGSIKDTAMNYIKGFMAVSLFTVVPVNLYSLCVSLQGTFGSAITGITDAGSIGLTAQQVLMSASFPGVGNPILQIFCAIMMGYADKGVLCKLKKGRHSADPDRSRKPLYVLCTKRIHRRIYPVVQAGHWYLHHCIFTVHHFNRRTYGV